MNVTTQQMRKSVKGWLKEEKATVEQALALQSALEGGNINGMSYQGKRESRNGDLDLVTQFQTAKDAYPTNDAKGDDYEDCGCLLETFEKIKHGRPSGLMGAYSSESYSLAMLIGLGDTPTNSRWVRAAIRGVQDYVAEIEK